MSVGGTDKTAVYEAAIASDHHSKSAYVGRVTQTEQVTIITEDGTAIEKEVSFLISWDSISKILGLIRNRVKAANQR